MQGFRSLIISVEIALSFLDIFKNYVHTYDVNLFPKLSMMHKNGEDKFCDAIVVFMSLW